MVLIISTFKVANGMEAEVRQAFLDRPGLVDDAPGFLGMEVGVDREDTAIFHLLTRWTDEASFQSWHRSAAHKLSHRGIPKGLKLDASETSVRKFDVLPAAKPPTLPQMPLYLRRCWSVHWLRASFDGRIIEANPAFEALFEGPGDCLWDRVTEPDAARIQAMLKPDHADSEAPVLLNFVSRDQDVRSLECYLERHEEDFVLVGEPARGHDRELATELMEMNNRWALLVRENEKNTKQLRRALAELDESHWHLRKIQETLPICMFCGKVKTGDAHWEGVVDYLKANTLFLSHGCCPACLEKQGG